MQKRDKLSAPIPPIMSIKQPQYLSYCSIVKSKVGEVLYDVGLALRYAGSLWGYRSILMSGSESMVSCTDNERTLARLC